MNINYSNGVVLVSGPVKSGKSKFAENILSHKEDVTYLATFAINDSSISWQNRIAEHKLRRPSHWKTVESNNISNTINNLTKKSSLLVDSLGGFVFAYLDLDDDNWQKLMATTINSIINFDGLILIVAEEAGWGVSPSSEVGNKFRDRLGLIIEKLSSISTDSWLVLHGRAINISINSIPI